MVIHVQSSFNLEFQMRLCVVIFNAGRNYCILVDRSSFMRQVNYGHVLHLCSEFLSISFLFLFFWSSLPFISYLKGEIKWEREVWVELDWSVIGCVNMTKVLYRTDVYNQSLIVVDKKFAPNALQAACSLLPFMLLFFLTFFSLSFLISYRKFSK